MTDGAEAADVKPQRVLIVDDSPGFRGLLHWYLGTLPGIEIVGEAADGEAALTAVARTKPDLVLMDVRMPNLNGLQACKQLRSDGQSARVLLLTAYGDAIPRWLAAEAGADDVIDKSNLGDRLREAIAALSTKQEPSS
jgi:DNA-binding NarL/FixJ family response regulator